MNKIKNALAKIPSKVKKGYTLFTAGLTALSLSTVNAFAAGEAATEAATQETMDGILGQILKIILMVFRYVGILLLVWAIIQIILAFKNDDPDSKQKGMVLAVISVVLITMSAVLKPILSSLGISL